MKPTLVVLAAGMGSRYGGLKQVDPVGPSGEAILDYSVFDAQRAGFGDVVFVIRRDIEEAFKRQVGAKYEHVLPVSYAFQDREDLPAPFTVPEGREKPWGTAHAIRAARNAVRGPFAAINADDFYGRDAFARLAAFLAAPAAPGPARFAMVGFELGKTLSENGSVARGICRVTPEGRLASVTEMTKIVRAGTAAENREDPAHPVPLALEDRVSMNLWGFTPALFDEMETRFPAWLAENGATPKKEWQIPSLVSELLNEGHATVDVLPTSSRWFGVTYREDRPGVVAELARLVSSGEYPTPLFAS